MNFSLFLYKKVISTAYSIPCNKRVYKTGIVCVCNVTYCDTLEFKHPEKFGEVLVVTSSRKGLRFKQTETMFSINSSYVGTNTFIINRQKMFQKIEGFGNAFTGAVSYHLDMMPQELQNFLYQSYFSTKIGNAFNMLRIPIAGCDFDIAPWAYNEVPKNDKTLSNFTKLDQRDLRKIEQINALKTISENNDIKLVGAAWSSPPWMKTNNDWTGYGSLKDEYYQTWADYHVKYLKLMKEKGMDYWAISTGNEPMNGVIGFLFVKFMSLGWTASNSAKWVANNLGPMMRSNFPDVKIFAGDDQRYTFPSWFDTMYKSYPESEKFIDGHAVHWYWDQYITVKNIQKTYEKYPNKLIISTEACNGDKPWNVHKPVIGDWKRGEDYVIDILESLNHFTNGWIDWNMVLDEEGGPNYVKNFVDSPVVVNSTSELQFTQKKQLRNISSLF